MSYVMPAFLFKLATRGLILLTLQGQLFAYESCYDDWFCVLKDEQGNGIAIENKTVFPVVVHLTGSWRLNDAREKLDVSIPLGGNASYLHKFVQPLASVWPSLHYKVTWVGGELRAHHNDQYRYQLPFAAGERFSVVQGFNGFFSHRGASRYAVDFAMPIGSAVHAARGGFVIDTEARHWRGGSSRRYAKYANYIIVLHDDGTTGEYYHLQQHGVLVKRGQSVSKGQHIGYSGNTGFSSLPHLHFAVYQALEGGKYQSIPFKFQSK